MAKKKVNVIKSVWEPEHYETEIGEKTYVLKPQPIGRVMEFDALLNDIGGMFEAIGPTFAVVDEAGETVVEYDTAEEAEEFIADLETEEERAGLKVDIQATSTQDFLSQIVATPYHLLLPLIPDLKEEDVAAAPVAQIEFVIRLLIEVNGVKWFEAMLKNLLEPLLPTILEAVISAVSEGSTNSTGKEAA
jgi:hypothetical protein